MKSYTGADAYLSRTPAQWDDLVRTAAPSFKGPYPRVSIWHGTSDSAVNNANQTELMKQWTNANGIDQTPDANDSVDGFPHAAYKDVSGKTLVETYTITGQSHDTEVAPSAPIDPAQPGGAKCGKAGAYILSAGICSTYYPAKFFGLDGAGTGGASTGDMGSSSGASSSSSSSSGAAGGTSGGAGTKFTPGSAPSSCNVVMVGNDSGATLLVLGAALGLVRAARRRSRASRS